jgi:EAL domain-containing protein (putative c-di-GMP-specific phosphodiesterase class I)
MVAAASVGVAAVLAAIAGSPLWAAAMLGCGALGALAARSSWTPSATAEPAEPAGPTEPAGASSDRPEPGERGDGEAAPTTTVAASGASPDLEVELARAIEQDELRLVYQPKINLGDDSFHGVEALVRWEHPERGLLPPSEFIPFAEQSSLIGPLTAWVLDHAVAQARTWADDGMALRVAVNVSAENLRDPRFPEQVARVLARHDVPAGLLELELTETAIIADPERVARAVRRLRELGVAVALDDFGQGSTSLAHLRNLPLTTLKIDKCFVDHLTAGGMDAAIVSAMIGLGHRLGLEVVAEGVETAEQCAALGEWGCDVAQGYFFDRPLAHDQIAGRFRARAAGSAGTGESAPSASAPAPTSERALLGDAGSGR